MTHNVLEIEGIGNSFANRLLEARINTIEDLLEEGRSKEGRKAIAEITNIDESNILRWVNMADLFRIKGIGEEYSDLLEATGVDTVPELAQRNPENLFNKMVEINNEKNLVRKVPSERQVSDWVIQAKSLPRKVNY